MYLPVDELTELTLADLSGVDVTASFYPRS